MSDQQDLSLLTDEEAELLKFVAAQEGGAIVASKLFDSIAIRQEALNDARAENKRKDEVITLFLENVNMVGVDDNGYILVRPSAITYFDKLRALLQSEKGVDMPKVTTEHCPKCCSLTHFEDVEIPVYRELGVPEPPEHYRIEVCPECGWQSEK